MPLGCRDSTPAAGILISTENLSAAVNQKPQMESVGKDMNKATQAMGLIAFEVVECIYLLMCVMCM